MHAIDLSSWFKVEASVASVDAVEAHVSLRLLFWDVGHGTPRWKALRWDDLGEMHGRRVHASVVSFDMQAAWHVHPPDSTDASSTELTVTLGLPPPRAGDESALKARLLVNFGVRATPLPASTLVKFSEFNAQFRPASEATRVKLPGFGALHDFAFTKKYYVLVQSPTSQAVAARKLGGRVAPGACLEIDKAKPTLVHLVPRGTGFIDAVEPISIEARSCVLAPLPLARPPPRAARARWSLIRE